MGDDVDITALTIEQYLALIQDNNRPGIVKPKISDDVEFKYSSNFMRELRCKLFTGTDDEDAHEHDKAVEQSKYTRSLEETIIKFCEESIKKQFVDDEWIRKFLKNTKLNIRELKTMTKILEEKTYQLIQTVLTNTGEKLNARTTMAKENMKEPVPRDLPPTPFLGHLKEQIGIPYRTRETICMIKNPREVHKMKAQEDDGDIDVVHDKEKILREEEYDYDIPLHDDAMQPLTPLTFHFTPPDDDYVASATNPILDKQLNEFSKEFFDITRVSKKEGAL
nr:hypothetical protein [Tanacetum cinerariifolium]